MCEERNDISQHKEFRKPPFLDDRMFLPMCKKNDVSQFHIDASCEECRSQKNKKSLYEVRAKGPVWAFLARDRASDIAYPFDLRQVRINPNQYAARLTASPYHKRDKVPCSSPNHLVKVKT